MVIFSGQIMHQQSMQGATIPAGNIIETAHKKK